LVLPTVRTRFVVARATLRTILGRYLGTAPQEVALACNRHGKPLLDRRVHATELQFNVSHSADLAVLAVTEGREVGIDVEALREVCDADRIAARHFDAAEQATYLALPAPLRREGFFVRWTLKEAYIKARGMGLAIPLSSFSVASVAGADGRHQVCPHDPEDGRRWSAMRLPALPGFAAALVAEGDDWQLVWRQWPGSSERGELFP